MSSNIEKFKSDLQNLLKRGELLEISMQVDLMSKEDLEKFKKSLDDDSKASFKNLPKFKSEYQSWYSEALALLRQTLPDRVLDFTRHYEKPKSRREINSETYTIEDYLQGINVTRGPYQQTVVGPSAATNRFDQQRAIVKAAAARFESSLFDIRSIVQADLLDSEIATAKELNKHKFVRAAGAIAGVVLERHLREVCENRKLLPTKKNPTISDFNEALKSGDVFGIPDWRFIQHLADIRNLCDHSKDPEPTQQQVTDLINGVDKIIKSIF
jgi:hypothetical protein